MKNFSDLAKENQHLCNVERYNNILRYYLYRFSLGLCQYSYIGKLNKRLNKWLDLDNGII